MVQRYVESNGFRASEFSRHKEIYQSDEQESERARLFSYALTHRLDELPVGYSLASCSPAELASASPTGLIVNNGQWKARTFFDGLRQCLNFLSHKRGAPQIGAKRGNLYDLVGEPYVVYRFRNPNPP